MGTSLMAYLGLDASNFHARLRETQNLTKEASSNLASSLGGMAAGAIAGFGAAGLIHSVLETVEHVRTLSREFRVSTDTIQIWERGAAKVGLAAEDVGNAMNRLKKARETAISGGDPGGFSAFGVTLMDLNDKAISTEGILRQMQDFTAGKPITDEQDVVAMELMGKSGAKILSVMQEINALGKIELISPEAIERIHESEAVLKRMKHELITGSAEVAGAGMNFIDRAVMGFEGFKQFMSGNMSWNQARRIAVEDHIDAPKYDFKGRLIPGPKAKAVPGTTKPDEVTPQPAESTGASKSDRQQFVQSQKEMAGLEKERDALAKKILENQQKAMTIGERQLSLKKEIAEHERNAELAMRIGNEHLSISEKMLAEDARGRLKQDHKVEHMDFTSAEKIGAFSNVSALHSAGMDHAAKTAKNTADSAKFLADIARAVTSHYTLDEKNNRAKNTMDLAEGMQRVRFS